MSLLPARRASAEGRDKDSLFPSRLIRSTCVGSSSGAMTGVGDQLPYSRVAQRPPSGTSRCSLTTRPVRPRWLEALLDPIARWTERPGAEPAHEGAPLHLVEALSLSRV